MSGPVMDGVRAVMEGRGPGMPGPYRAAILQRAAVGIRTVGRPVKAPPAVCGCRSPSSFRRGFGCLRHGVSSGCGAFASRYA